jgi:hypothetical protein
MSDPTVIHGLLAGLAATGAMTLLEIVARSRWGLEGLLEWQENQTVAAWITKGAMEDAVVPGLGFHFLHGLLAGIVFVLVLPLFPSMVPLWVLGPGYGVVLFAITLVIHGPITGRSAWAGPRGSIALALSLLSHMVYGAALALLVVWP